MASTYGEGDPPDAAAAFASLMQTAAAGAAPQLSGLRYAVLALGDSEYAQFCGFGRALDEWLRAQGAQPLFDRVDVDNGDAAALRHWQHHLGLLAGRGDLPDWETPAYEPWRLQGRERLNPDSQGGPCYLLTLALPPGAAPAWQAGDIAEIGLRRERGGELLPHREYSIASLPADGALQLLVRQMRGPDGDLGPGQRLADPRGAAGRRDRSPAAVQPQFPRARRRPADDPDRQRHRRLACRALLKRAPGGGPPSQLAGVRRAPGRA